MLPSVYLEREKRDSLIFKDDIKHQLFEAAQEIEGISKHLKRMGRKQATAAQLERERYKNKQSTEVIASCAKR